MDWLRSLPLTFEAPGFRCANGDFSHPAGFRYIIEPREALPSWNATPEQLLFVGHSHLAGIYVVGASGQPHFVEPCDFEIESGKSYIVKPRQRRVSARRRLPLLYCFSTTRPQHRFPPAALRLRRVPESAEGAGWRRRLDSPPGRKRHRLPWLRETSGLRQAQTPVPEPSRPRPACRAPRFRSGGLRASDLRDALGFVLCAALSRRRGYVAYVRHASAGGPLAVTVPDYDPSPIAVYPLRPPDKNFLPCSLVARRPRPHRGLALRL
jgi:hypothetical protein